MKKIRILALLLAVLMIPFSLLVACKKDSDEDDVCSVNGHEWNKKEVTIEKRTCTTPGLKERTCKVCKKVERYEWKPEGHTIAKAEWVYNEDATCTEDGHETRSCALCPYSETRVKKGTALGHIFLHYALSEDGYSETAVCNICSVVTDTRLVGINIDFEGEKNTLSYSAFTVYTPEGVTDYYKTEGENETLNSYLQIDRTADVNIGDHGYGAILAPGYSRLKENSYVAEFDVKINKDNTGDLVLLQGNKEYTSVDFLSYDADAHTFNITYGPIYTLKDTDYDRWMKLSVVLNDIERKYEFYIDGKLVISGVEYQNDDYFAGMNLENFKIAMTHEVGVASTFALDNIDIYIAYSPKGYEGATLDPDYAVFETQHTKNKIMYKKLTDGCTHNLSAQSVAADCYNDGYSYKLCSVCNGKTEFATTEAKLSHSMVAIPESEGGVKEATCTEYGAIYKKCSLCGYKDKEVVAMKDHEIDTDAASYRNVPANCLADGYITGECKVCHCEMNLFNGEYKSGHNIVDIEVKQEANCVRDGYSQGRCINPGCGITVTTNEIPAYGHLMKSVIKDGKNGKEIENFCLRCNLDEYKTTQPLGVLGVYPTFDEMKEALGDSFYGGSDGSGFSNGAFSTGTNKSQMRFTNDSSSSTAAKVTEGKNTFLRIKHTATGYLNYIDDLKQKDKDVVLEISLRLPATGKSVTGYMTAGHRDKPGHNAVMRVFALDENGNIIFDPTTDKKVTIGTLNSTEFSKISFVFHQSEATVDVYFNGALVVQNHLISNGNAEYKLPEGGLLYEYRFMFDNVTSGERGLDVDDMFLYQASYPVYITNPFLPNTAGTVYDASNNVPSDSGETPYIPNGAAEILGAKMQISSNKGFRAYVENVSGRNGNAVSALHCIKGDSVTSISGANTGKDDSEISTLPTIMNNSGAVISNEIKFNAGSFTGGKMNSGKIVLAQGRKVVDSQTYFCDFLYVENGVIYSGDKRGLYAVKQDEWISYEVVVNEKLGSYDIYLNGICQAAGVKCGADYSSAKYGQLGYKFMFISGGEFDFYMANTALYAGAVAPASDVVVGKIEKVTVKTELVQKFDAVKFYENQSISSYYDYVGETILSTDGHSLLQLSDAARYAKKEGAVLTKLDSKNVLKVTGFKTNNLKALEFKNLVNTKLSGSTVGTYDLSGYDYLTVSLNVEATTGYNVIFKLMTANGYYQMRVYLTTTGWQTVTMPLFANPENENAPCFKSVGTTSGKMDDVVALRIEFEGGIAGNGNGKLMDGTTISFEAISFENDTFRYEEYVGENLDTGNFCKTTHTYTDEDVETIAPTCKKSGYLKRVCNVCGHIEVVSIKPPLKNSNIVVAADKNVVSTQSCVNHGITVDHFVCNCGENDCVGNFYMITEFKPALDHVVADGSCTLGCGKELAE